MKRINCIAAKISIGGNVPLINLGMLHQTSKGLVLARNRDCCVSMKCPTGPLLWRAGGGRKVGSLFPVIMVLLHIYSAILGTKVELFTALQQFSKPPSKK